MWNKPLHSLDAWWLSGGILIGQSLESLSYILCLWIIVICFSLQSFKNIFNKVFMNFISLWQKRKKKRHEKHRQWLQWTLFFFSTQFHFSSLHGWQTNNSTSKSGPQTSCIFPLRIMLSHSHHFLFFSESFRNCYFIRFICVSNLNLHEWSQVTIVLILSYCRINLASNIGGKNLDFLLK